MAFVCRAFPLAGAGNQPGRQRGIANTDPGIQLALIQPLFRERRYAGQNSPAALRLELEPGEQQDLKVNVLKRRGSWPGQRCSLAMAQRADLSFRETTRVVRGPWSGSTG